MEKSHEKQLNVWIDASLKDALDERCEREGKKLKELVNGILRQDVARERGELIEQQALPIVREIVDTTFRKYLAQLRTDLRDDMQVEIVDQMKIITRNSDNRLAALIVRAVRDTGILRRLSFAHLAKAFGTDFANDAYNDARERSGKELAPHPVKEEGGV